MPVYKSHQRLLVNPMRMTEAFNLLCANVPLPCFINAGYVTVENTPSLRQDVKMEAPCRGQSPPGYVKNLLHYLYKSRGKTWCSGTPAHPNIHIERRDPRSEILKGNATQTSDCFQWMKKNQKSKL